MLEIFAATNPDVSPAAFIMFFCVIGLAVCAYFAPFLIAAMRGHRQAAAIGALNLLLGWTMLGWVAAFVWSLTDTR